MNSYPQGSNQQKSEDNSGLFTALAGIGLTGLGIIGGRRLGNRYRTEPVNVKVDPGATADVRRASTVDIPKIPSEVKRQQEIQEFYQKARQPSRGGAVVTDLSQQNPQVATNTGQDLTKAAQTEAANQFLAQGKERTGVSGGLTKPSSSPSDLLSQTIEEVSVKIFDSPQPQIPGGSLGQGRLTSYPTTSQRKTAYDAAAAKPESELPPVRIPSGGVDVELITDPVTGEKFAPGRSPAGTTPRSYLEDQGFVDNTMVDQQDARVGLQVDQSVAAMNSAEDQATGRMMHRLQANEDLDIGAVNAAKEQVETVLEDTISRNPELASATPLDAAANSVARSLPDGAPIDQAESGGRIDQLVEQGRRYLLAKEVDLSYDYGPENRIQTRQVNQRIARAQELKDTAEQIIREQQGKFSPVELAQQKSQAERAQLSAQGFVGGALERQLAEKMQGSFPEGKAAMAPLEQETRIIERKGMPSALSTVANVGEDPYSTLTQAASNTSIRGRSRIQNEPEQFRQRFDSTGRAVEDDYVYRDEGGTNTYSMGEELSELDLDPSRTEFTRRIKNPVTGTMVPEYAPKGQRAVKLFQGEGEPDKIAYRPETDPGGIGIYGEERSFAGGPKVKFDPPMSIDPVTKQQIPSNKPKAGEYTKTAQRKPTDLPYPERKGTGIADMSTSQLEGFVKNVKNNPRAAAQATDELDRRKKSNASLQVSEALRRASIEGRDPQSVLRDLGFGV